MSPGSANNAIIWRKSSSMLHHREPFEAGGGVAGVESCCVRRREVWRFHQMISEYNGEAIAPKPHRRREINLSTPVSLARKSGPSRISSIKICAHQIKGSACRLLSATPNQCCWRVAACWRTRVIALADVYCRNKSPAILP